jgi:hypothetical protein
MCSWGNIDVSFYRDFDGMIKLPSNLAEIEQVVNANPYRFTLGRGRQTFKILSNIIEESIGNNKNKYLKYNVNTYDKLKIEVDKKLLPIEKKFWQKGEISFSYVSLVEDFNSLEQRFISNLDSLPYDYRNMLCLAIPKSAKNLHTALFVIDQLISPQLRMERVNSILNEQITEDLSLPSVIDSNYVIRYYDDFKYCRD